MKMSDGTWINNSEKLWRFWDHRWHDDTCKIIIHLILILIKENASCYNILV
jgi:hypothetical protein